VYLTTLSMGIEFKSRNLYKNLYNLSRPGIIVFENKAKKKVLIKATTNILSCVSKLVSSLTTKKHINQELIKDRTKLTLLILETDVSDLWSLRYWGNHYKSLGYAFYSHCEPSQLNLRLRADYRFGMMVELYDKANRPLVVGVFSTKVEALSWIDTYYINLDHINPVFACNLETIMYYKSLNEKNS
jgi:hypothetical protein